MRKEERRCDMWIKRWASDKGRKVKEYVIE